MTSRRSTGCGLLLERHLLLRSLDLLLLGSRTVQVFQASRKLRLTHIVVVVVVAVCIAAAVLASRSRRRRCCLHCRRHGGVSGTHRDFAVRLARRRVVVVVHQERFHVACHDDEGTIQYSSWSLSVVRLYAEMRVALAADLHSSCHSGNKSRWTGTAETLLLRGRSTLALTKQSETITCQKEGCLCLCLCTMNSNRSLANSSEQIAASSSSLCCPLPHNNSNNCSFFVIQVTCMASLGGILFGYDLGVISGALPQLAAALDLQSQQQELVVSVLYIGGGLGASAGGWLCDALGRRRAILYADVGFLLGGVVLATAPHLTAVVLGRLLVGFAVAVSGIADVSYLHEMAPVKVRGAVVSVNEACISAGFLLAFYVASVLSERKNGWRIMFGLSGVLAAVQFCGMWGMPESPKWLYQQGRFEESAAALRRIEASSSSEDKVDNNPLWIELQQQRSDSDDLSRGGDASKKEPVFHLPQKTPSNLTTERVLTPGLGVGHTADYLATAAGASRRASSTSSLPQQPDTSSSADDLVYSTAASITDDDDDDSSKSRLLFLRTCWFPYRLRQQLGHARQSITKFASTVRVHYRKQAYIALFLAVAQQLSGQTVVLSYAPLIFATTQKYSEESTTTTTSNTGASATVAIGVVKFVVTVLVIWKIERLGRRFLLLTGMATICMGLFFLTAAFWGGGTDNSNVLFLALPGVLLVVCGYSMSFGPLTWLLTSELFATDIRGRALGVSTIVTYLMASVVTYTFLSAQEWVGPSMVFLFYLLATSFGWVFACLAIPDTGGLSVEQAEEKLRQMYWWKESFVVSADDASPLFPGRDLPRDGPQGAPVFELHEPELI